MGRCAVTKINTTSYNIKTSDSEGVIKGGDELRYFMV